MMYMMYIILRFIISCNINHNNTAYYVILFNNKQDMDYRYGLSRKRKKGQY